VFVAGEARGGLLWDGENMRRGDDARAFFADNFGRLRNDLGFYKLSPGAGEVLALGLAGEAAIARIPAAALNLEEYLAWVGEVKKTVLVSIVAGRGAANILIKGGKILGAVIAPSTNVAAEPDEALALYYSPGATIEVFAELKRTP
jgi:hypothetical protein